MPQRSRGAGAGARRRRTRCRRCRACLRSECGACHFCRDMKKFGGPGRMKQSCLLRQCTAPVLPHTAVCRACGEAGREAAAEGEEERLELALMECSICSEIVHPRCLQMGRAEAVINPEIPNCWECPKCKREGRSAKEVGEGGAKRRGEDGDEGGGRWGLEEPPPALPPPQKRKGGAPDETPPKPRPDAEPDGPPRKKLKGVREENPKKAEVTWGPGAPPELQPPGGGPPPSGPPDAEAGRQRERLERFRQMCRLLERAPPPGAPPSSSSSSSSGSDSGGATPPSPPPPSAPLPPPPPPPLPPPPTATKPPRTPPPLLSPPPRYPPNLVSAPPRGFFGVPPPQNRRVWERHVVRPPPATPDPDRLPLDSGAAHVMQRDVWLAVFLHLSSRELCVCMRVCRTWSRWCCDRRLWTRIDLSRRAAVTPSMLSGIVRRQPASLDLSWTGISRKQLSWLISRLQGLRELVLSGCSWCAVSALGTASLASLRLLDLRWVPELRDAQLRELLPDARGPPEPRGRLPNLVELRLAGLEVTEVSLRLVARHAPQLASLDLSHCARLGDGALGALGGLRHCLAELNLAGCPRLTDQCLPALRRCPRLRRVDLRSCRLVSPEACARLCQNPPPGPPGAGGGGGGAPRFRAPEEKLLLKDS